MISVGFKLTVVDTRVQLRYFGQNHDLLTRHLSSATNGPVTVAMIGRLFYRSSTPRADAGFAADVYCRGGLKALAGLEGEFGLVGFDRDQNRLFALRDPLGTYPLFWTSQGGTVTVSTSILPLMEETFGDLNPEYVADWLSFPFDSVAELPSEQTPYRSVRRLLPGCTLDAHICTLSVKTFQHYDWNKQIRPVEAKDAAEAGEIVLDRLERAVVERLHPAGIACHFSGGFDSTGIALLAERRLRDRGEHIHALTLMYPRSATRAGERQYIESAVANYPGIHHHQVDASDYLEWDSHENCPLLDEPSAKVADLWPSLELVRVARQNGVYVILSGHGGDHLFYRSGIQAAVELFRCSRFISAARLSWGQGLGMVKLIQAALIQALPLGARRRMNGLLRAIRSADPTMIQLQVPPWIRTDYVKAFDITQRTLEWARPRMDESVFNNRGISYIAGDWYHWNIAVPLGLSQSRPFFDPRVVTTALGLPIALHVDSAVVKPVLGRALRHVLPLDIRNRVQKTTGNEARDGFARHRRWLSSLCRETQPLGEVIDFVRLHDCIDKAALGIHDSLPLWRLRMTIGLLLWLSQRKPWQNQNIRWLSPAACKSLLLD